MNIVIAANDKFIFGTEVFLYSLLKHNRNVKVFFLHAGVKQEALDRLANVAETYGKNSSFTPITVDASLFIGVPTSDIISIESYFRLLIPQLFPEERRVLYLDTDIIVRKPLDRLYNMDLNGMYAAACEDWGLHIMTDYRERVCQQLGFADNQLYFNAGVWLFNLEEIRKEHSNSYFMDVLWENVDKLTFHDQDVLNLSCKGRILPIDFVFNSRIFHLSRRDEGFLLDQSYILHYFQKPWNPHFTDICGYAFWKEARELGYRKEYWQFACRYTIEAPVHRLHMYLREKRRRFRLARQCRQQRKAP